MEKSKNASINNTIFAIIIWGGLWGIFEATLGFVLHLLPISIGWLVWYSVASFFMGNVYRTTRRVGAVICIGVLSAGIKLLNLLTPIRVDKVINPAVSIICEALSFAVILFVYSRLKVKKTVLSKGIAVVAMNTAWRVLYSLYLLIIAPDWIKDISVISSADEILIFFVSHNLISSFVIFCGVLLIKHILKPIMFVENKMSSLSCKTSTKLKFTGAILFLLLSITLEYLL